MNKIRKILLLFSLFSLKFAYYQTIRLKEGEHHYLQTSEYGVGGFYLYPKETEEGDNIRVFVNSNDIDFSVDAWHWKYDENDCDVDIEERHAEITFKRKLYDDYVTVKIIATKDATYDIYFETYKTAGEIALTIFIVIICIGAAICLIYILKKLYIFKKKEDEKQKRLIKEKKEKRKLVDIFYEIIKENPDRLNMICPICFIDKNGKLINNEEYNPIILNEYDGDIENYKNNLIQGIKSGKITKIESDFLKVKQKQCEHFHHEKCIKIIEKRLKGTWDWKFRCNFCEEYITPEYIKAFHPISENEFKTAMYYYTDNIKLFKHENYIIPLKKSILHFIYSSDEISQEIKNKIKKARQLTLKFRDLYFWTKKHIEIGYNDDLDYYEKKYYEEKEEHEENVRKGMERRERERREMENNRNQQPREMSSKSSTSGKEEKVDCLSCSDCMGHCVFCFASCPKAGGYKAHKSCYSDKKCVICKNKKGQFTVIGKCTKCGSKGSKYYNKCFICGELL